MNYLITFTPLEPYSFGTDQTFDFSGRNKTGKESYIAESTETPEQTTILGTLRWMALLKAGILKETLSYTEEERSKIAETAGPESFSFLGKGQTFGRIRSVSPLFLTDGRSVLVRNPFHNKAAEAGYEPMRLGENCVRTSAGMIRLPADSEQFNAKDGHVWNWIDLNSGTIHKDLFKTAYVTGNRKVIGGSDRDKGFYRRKTVLLKQGYAFAVLVTASEDAFPEDCVVCMGMKRSSFRARTMPADLLFTDGENKAAGELLKEKTEAFFNTGETWYYALSDLYAPEGFVTDAFSIIEEKNIRNLETRYEEESGRLVPRRSSIRFNLVQAGSVFYGSCPTVFENSSPENSGYNVICKLGGK